MSNLIESHETRLRDAMLAGDVAQLELLIDDRLIFIGPDNGVYGKQDDLALYRAGAQKVSCIDVQDMQIAMHGHTAIVTVLADVSGHFMGAPFSGRYRYIRTWHMHDSAWRIIAGSVARTVHV